MEEKSSSGSIYIVDDEAAPAGSLAAVLKREGFRVATFTDARAALDRAQWNPPQLLLAEVFLPEMSGVELAIAMGYAAPHCRVLLFSESPRVKPLLERTREQGYSFEFVRKPFQFGELAARCRRMAMGWTGCFAGSVLPGVPFSQGGFGESRDFRKAVPQRLKPRGCWVLMYGLKPVPCHYG